MISRLVCQAMESNLDWVIPRTELCDTKMNRSGEIIPAESVQTDIVEGNVQGLFRRLCFGCCLPASGSLFRRRLLLDVGGFNSKFQLVEDWPLFLSLIRRGVCPQISEEVVVLHRAFRRRLLLDVGGFNSKFQLVEDWPLFLSLIRRGVCPQISEEVVVLHRAGGVSGRQAARNRVYQQDLLLVMQTEIKPYLQNLDEFDRQKVIQQIQDKEAVFQLRFSCTTWKNRLVWGASHIGTILRKLL